MFVCFFFVCFFGFLEDLLKVFFWGVLLFRVFFSFFLGVLESGGFLLNVLFFCVWGNVEACVCCFVF